MRGFDRKVVLELVGTAAIVASLIFVGLQMKQAQNIAIAEQYQNRAIAFKEFTYAAMEIESLQRVGVEQVETVYESGAGGEAFNDVYEEHGSEYAFERSRQILADWVMLESYYLQYQLGTMTEESWRPYRYRLKGFLRDPYARWIYTEAFGPENFPESFQLLCDEIITEIESESDSFD